jgi:hypothetical protein
MQIMRFFICVYLCSSVVLLFSGCGAAPSQVNIELRKELQDLRAQNSQLERQHAADAATIAALQHQSTIGGPVAQLDPAKLDKLFTTAEISLGKLAGGYDADPNTPGDEAIRVQATPKDASGQQLKAAGSFVIEAFDLTGDGRLLGRWNYDVDQSKAAWRGDALLYAYVFTIPLEQRPSTPQITLKVTFTDELTGRQFTAQRSIGLRLPGSGS